MKSLILALVLLGVFIHPVVARAAAAVEGSVILTMDSTKYCVGAPWNLSLSNAAPNAEIRLYGTVNNAPWDIRQWAVTDSSGNFKTSGAYAATTAGRYTMSAEIASSVSDPLQLEIVNCGWRNTASMGTASWRHVAIVLTDSRVLVMGPMAPFSGDPGSAELFDPATETWSVTGHFNTPRVGFTATLLPNGKVLVAGGYNYELVSASVARSQLLDSSELYDPQTGMWSVTGQPNAIRYDRTATLLPNGKVLLAAGRGLNLVGDGNELYDPSAGTWRMTGSYGGYFDGTTTATLLLNGKVLFVGVTEIESEEEDCIPRRTRNVAALYDPTTEMWSSIASPYEPHGSHTATLLTDGKVLVRGETVTELYNPETSTWSFTGSTNSPMTGHTATLLPNGKVLTIGGSATAPPTLASATAKAELYDPETGTWSDGARRSTARRSHTATVLSSGKVLVVGGVGATGQILRTAELYEGGFELPVLTLNSTSYCIGDPWTLVVTHPARAASLRLVGTSNGASWEIAQWGAIDAAGSFEASGIFANGTRGVHILRVEIRGVWSTAASFVVSNC